MHINQNKLVYFDQNLLRLPLFCQQLHDGQSSGRFYIINHFLLRSRLIINFARFLNVIIYLTESDIFVQDNHLVLTRVSSGKKTSSEFFSSRICCLSQNFCIFYQKLLRVLFFFFFFTQKFEDNLAPNFLFFVKTISVTELKQKNHFKLCRSFFFVLGYLICRFCSHILHK